MNVFIDMSLVAVYILLVVGVRATQEIRDCGSDFNAEEALQRTGYANEVVLPRQNDWTDKYIIEKSARDMMFCDGSIDEFYPGIWGLDSAMAAKLRRLSEGEASGCCIYGYPDNTYEYCDTKRTGVIACDGPLPNVSYFDSMGEVGQDCTSWQMLSEFLELGGELTLSELFASECKRIFESRRGGSIAPHVAGAVNTEAEAPSAVNICTADENSFPIITGYTQAFVGHYEYAQIASDIKGYNDPGTGYAACVTECDAQPTCVAFSVKNIGTCFFLVSKDPTKEFYGFGFTATNTNYCSYVKD
jgi:hypothetical protein